MFMQDFIKLSAAACELSR